MSNLEGFSERVWTRLFDFVFPDESQLTRGEVLDDLRQARVDMRASTARLQALITRRRETEAARLSLEAARRARPAVVERLLGIRVPSTSQIREKLKEMIVARFAAPQQGVWARKLESAASDEDLKSLLEDLSRLDSLSEGTKDGKIERE